MIKKSICSQFHLYIIIGSLKEFYSNILRLSRSGIHLLHRRYIEVSASNTVLDINIDDTAGYSVFEASVSYKSKWRLVCVIIEHVVLAAINATMPFYPILWFPFTSMLFSVMEFFLLIRRNIKLKDLFLALRGLYGIQEMRLDIITHSCTFIFKLMTEVINLFLSLIELLIWGVGLYYVLNPVW